MTLWFVLTLLILTSPYNTMYIYVPNVTHIVDRKWVWTENAPSYIWLVCQRCGRGRETKLAANSKVYIIYYTSYIELNRITWKGYYIIYILFLPANVVAEEEKQSWLPTGKSSQGARWRLKVFLPRQSWNSLCFCFVCHFDSPKTKLSKNNKQDSSSQGLGWDPQARIRFARGAFWAKKSRLKGCRILVIDPVHRGFSILLVPFLGHPLGQNKNRPSHNLIFEIGCRTNGNEDLTARVPGVIDGIDVLIS